MALTTGQVAGAADVNIQTVRHYERRGPVPAPGRTASGYRQYPDSVVRRIRFIKRAEGLGFSLREIQELLALRVRPGASADAVQHTICLNIECVERKIRRLRRIKHALEQPAAACAARQSPRDFLFAKAVEEAPPSWW